MPYDNNSAVLETWHFKQPADLLLCCYLTITNISRFSQKQHVMNKQDFAVNAEVFMQGKLHT